MVECLPFTEYQMETALSRLEGLLSETFNEVECQQIINKMKWLGYELFKIQQKNQETTKLNQCKKEETEGETKQLTTHKLNHLTPVHSIPQNEVNLHKNQVFTTEQLLKYYNGKNGNPLYVCVEGLVFDVTDLPDWENGQVTEDCSTCLNLPSRIAKMQSDKIKQLIKQAKLVGVIILS